MWRRPAFWLTVQPLVLLAFLTATGGMTVHIQPDTGTYLEADLTTWRDAASQMRTLGYPLFLRAVQAFSPSLQALPYLQFGLHAMSVAALYVGLRRYGLSSGAALAASSVLLYSRFFLEYAPVALTDAPAFSLTVLTIACLAAVAAGGGAWAWIGLTVFLALAYHVRPAYLFLLPLTPALGLALAWLRPIAERRSTWLRLAMGLLLAAAGPFLVYCGLRWATVGHFGLVSFGGYNVIGIAGQFLTPEVAEELSPRVRPLAVAILEKREEIPQWRRDEGYFALVENYNVMVWTIAAPAARELYDDEVVVNQRLGELARETLRARPAAFVLWLKSAAKHGLAQVLEHAFLDPPGLFLLIALAVCQAALVARRRRGESARAVPSSPPSYFLAYQATLLIALAVALAKLALVVLVEPPIGRYVAPAASFLPMWLAVALLDRVQRLRAYSR